MKGPNKGVMQLVTPIKINLALHVVGQRPDGYHLLESLVYFSLDGDVLTYLPAQTDGFEIDGPYASGLSADADNLVTQARRLLALKFPEKARPCLLKLTKNLPIASGVGGGSGDAAGVLQLLGQQWKIDCAQSTWMEMALTLGADVPMCLSALRSHTPLFVQGVGERLGRLNDASSIALVLVNHGQQISTPEIFKTLPRKDNPALDLLPMKLDSVDHLIQSLHNTRNDLYQPALTIAPELANVLASLNRHHALFSRMSGSGATCFGIYADIYSAKSAAAAIHAEQPHWFVKAVETVGSRPKSSKEANAK